MKWHIEFYETLSGFCPVIKFIEKLTDEKLKTKLRVRIGLLEDKGIYLSEPNAEKLTNTDMWELKVKHKRNEYRILYFFSGVKVILVHAFMKKTQKVPRREIKLAEKRKRDWERRFKK